MTRHRTGSRARRVLSTTDRGSRERLRWGRFPRSVPIRRRSPLFHVPPADPPAGDGWSVWNEHVDLASSYFETASLPGTPAHGPVGDTPAPADLAAGRYELKFELFDADGNLANWTDEDIDLRITKQNAPFGTGTIETEDASGYNRILEPGSGDTLGFRMVLRVDDNHCFADIDPVEGDVPPDPACGFHEYASLTDDARLSRPRRRRGTRSPSPGRPSVKPTNRILDS